MNYKEALFFIGKCLTLGHHPEKTDEIRKVIRSGSVVWEQVVWASTDQLVFSALYLQLKRAGLLPELPSDLVEYMEEFTSLNRDRNYLIINQAYEISELLNHHGIVPIFLKGTGHLLDGLYDDIGERQVGDIDILVEENDMVRAAEILISVGYAVIDKFDPNLSKVFRHYPRLIKNDRTAAIEIHRQIYITTFNKTENIGFIFQNTRKLEIPGKATVMCNEHQILYNIINVQINDQGYYFAKIFFRQIYDLFLLSYREDPQKAVNGFGKYTHQINVNIGLAYEILDRPQTLSIQPNWRIKLFLFRVYFKIEHPKWSRFSNGFLYLNYIFTHFMVELKHSIFDRQIRRYVWNRANKLQWYYEFIKRFKKVYLDK